MVIESGRVALTRQQHIQAEANFETHRDELVQLKVIVFLRNNLK